MSAPNPSPETTVPHPSEGLITLTHVIYALHAFSAFTGLLSSAFILTAFLTGWPSIIAVILNYAKRSEVRGTWLDSHFGWQIRVLVRALVAAVGRGGVRHAARHSGRAGGLGADRAVGALPHRARLDDAFRAEADAAVAATRRLCVRFRPAAIPNFGIAGTIRGRPRRALSSGRGGAALPMRDEGFRAGG